MKKLYFTITLFCSFLAFSQQAETEFPDTLIADEAFILQAATKKPIVFFFYTNWYKYCFLMKKNTFTNKNIVELLNENFHFVLFNTESKEPVKIKNKTFENDSGVHQLAVSLASKNGYMAYPTLVILNHKKRIDEQVNSFLSDKQLEKLLTKYLKKQKR